MIEEFMQALSRIRSLKQEQDWRAAGAELDLEFKKLVGSGPQSVAALSDTELLARLIQGESTHIVVEKTFMLVSLLKEAGDVSMVEGRTQEGQASYLKGLRLLVQALGSEEAYDCPVFVPKVEMFVNALQDVSLPLETQALLMQHYERMGEFARAEDQLFAMLDSAANDHRIAEFGITFYERLRAHSDAQLTAGGLPRPEIESGVTELLKRLRIT